MYSTLDTSAFTAVFGIVRGVVKAISAKPLPMAVSIVTLTNVMLYTAASATVGYLAKHGLERLSYRFKSKHSHQNLPNSINLNISIIRPSLMGDIKKCSIMRCNGLIALIEQKCNPLLIGSALLHWIHDFEIPFTSEQ